MASASEELSAQSENLRDIVQELADQIGGAKANTEIEAKKKIPAKKELAYHRRPALAARKTKENKDNKQFSKKNGESSGKTPEDIIPMEGDFNDF